MPKLTGPLFSVEAHGALGKALTFQRRPGGASVYGYKKPKVPLTTAQLYQRQSIAAAVKAWQYAHANLKALYEELAKGQGQSGYSLWMHERAIRVGGSLLYLPCVEGSGSIGHDVSGEGHHATLIGTTWGSVKRGYFLHHNGITNRTVVAIADIASMSVGTFITWISPWAVNAQYMYYLSWKYTADEFYWVNYTDGGNSARCFVGGQSFSQTLIVGGWTQLGVAWEADGKWYKILNGVRTLQAGVASVPLVLGVPLILGAATAVADSPAKVRFGKSWLLEQCLSVAEAKAFYDVTAWQYVPGSV